jgi:oxygen-independent coproporphyrinogen-3 oxidase
MRVLSLYIHIPFCTRRCPYCSFYHVGRSELAEDAFIDALVDELSLACADLGGDVGFETVFVGGGTPSAIGEGRLARIFDALERHLDGAVTAEVTCELNPEDVTPGLLELLRSRGVNRVSLGIQSMDAAAQRVLRRCSPAVNRRALSYVRERFDNVSVDVLLGVPGATAVAARATLEEVVAAGCTHVSAYCLEPGGDMAREVERFFDGVDPERCADEYLMACEKLSAAGFLHYEVSNFARPGFESRHNCVYWNGGEYLGVGPGAHSFLEGRRLHNAPSLAAYMTGRGRDRVADQNADGALERAMLALRTAEGMPLWWARCGEDTIDGFVADGLARRDGDRLVLTDRGFLVTNEIVLRVCASN